MDSKVVYFENRTDTDFKGKEISPSVELTLTRNFTNVVNVKIHCVLGNTFFSSCQMLYVN